MIWKFIALSYNFPVSLNIFFQSEKVKRKRRRRNEQTKQPFPGYTPISSSSFGSKFSAPPSELWSQNEPLYGGRMQKLEFFRWVIHLTVDLLSTYYVSEFQIASVPPPHGFDWAFSQCMGGVKPWFGHLCWQTLSDIPGSMGDLQAAHLWAPIPQKKQPS